MADDNKSQNKPKDTSATESTDSAAAKESGSTEGEIKALRDEGGLNQLPGHQANLAAWEASPAGQEFLKGEKDRKKAAEEQAKAEAESQKADEKVVQQYVETAQ